MLAEISEKARARRRLELEEREQQQRPTKRQLMSKPEPPAPAAKRARGKGAGSRKGRGKSRQGEQHLRCTCMDNVYIHVHHVHELTVPYLVRLSMLCLAPTRNRIWHNTCIALYWPGSSCLYSVASLVVDWVEGRMPTTPAEGIHVYSLSVIS